MHCVHPSSRLTTNGTLMYSKDDPSHYRGAMGAKLNLIGSIADVYVNKVTVHISLRSEAIE